MSEVALDGDEKEAKEEEELPEQDSAPSTSDTNVEKSTIDTADTVEDEQQHLEADKGENAASSESPDEPEATVVLSETGDNVDDTAQTEVQASGETIPEEAAVLPAQRDVEDQGNDSHLPEQQKQDGTENQSCSGQEDEKSPDGDSGDSTGTWLSTITILSTRFIRIRSLLFLSPFPIPILCGWCYLQVLLQQDLSHALLEHWMFPEKPDGISGGAYRCNHQRMRWHVMHAEFAFVITLLSEVWVVGARTTGAHAFMPAARTQYGPAAANRRRNCASGCSSCPILSCLTLPASDHLAMLALGLPLFNPSLFSFLFRIPANGFSHFVTKTSLQK